MRFVRPPLLFLLLGCSENQSAFTEKDHAVIKAEIVSNYYRNKQAFQSLASEVASFKRLRAVQFKYGRFGTDGIIVYFDSIDRDSNGRSFAIQNLNDPQSEAKLNDEGVSASFIESVKKRLDSLHCNGFFTLRAPNSNTGTSYIHTAFKYDSWNGANFYYYKVFDKKIEPDMIKFFDRKNVNVGSLKDTGGILDSNAVWYLKYD